MLPRPQLEAACPQPAAAAELPPALPRPVLRPRAAVLPAAAVGGPAADAAPVITILTAGMKFSAARYLNRVTASFDLRSFRDTRADMRRHCGLHPTIMERFIANPQFANFKRAFADAVLQWEMDCGALGLMCQCAAGGGEGALACRAGDSQMPLSPDVQKSNFSPRPFHRDLSGGVPPLLSGGPDRVLRRSSTCGHPLQDPDDAPPRFLFYCTSGRHRSVAGSRVAAALLQARGYLTSHQDLDSWGWRCQPSCAECRPSRHLHVLRGVTAQWRI